jgi:threonine dehydratase
MELPVFADVLTAADRIAGHLPPTPMWSYPVLDALVGATVHVKHENVQPTGAFKVRGGINLLAGLAAERLAAGVCTYSTGNHAQSIAYAARMFGCACIVVMPGNANPDKVQAVRALGARVELMGERLADTQEAAAGLAAQNGMSLIDPGGEPALVAGVGTAYLEMLTAAPELDAIFVPVGSGTGAAAACLVAGKLAPACRIVAVQSEAAPSAYESWRSGECVSRPDRTGVGGLATGRGFVLPQRLMTGLADFLLVSDQQIRSAQQLMMTAAHTLAEGAGAAALAGLLTVRDQFAGGRVGIVCTGGNASLAEIADVLAAPCW